MNISRIALAAALVAAAFDAGLEALTTDKGWDVCLLPFALNDSTRYISPTKTLEYMAAAKPIVGTPVPDGKYPFLVYVGEPAANSRVQIGVVVLFFLAAFFVITLLLKKEYWKDVR